MEILRSACENCHHSVPSPKKKSVSSKPNHASSSFVLPGTLGAIRRQQQRERRRRLCALVLAEGDQQQRSVSSFCNWSQSSLKRKKRGEKKRRPWRDLLQLSLALFSLFLSLLAHSASALAPYSTTRPQPQQPRAPPRLLHLCRTREQQQQQQRRGSYPDAPDAPPRDPALEEGRGLDDGDRDGHYLGGHRRGLPRARLVPELARGPGPPSAGGVRAVKGGERGGRSRFSSEFFSRLVSAHEEEGKRFLFSPLL